MLTLNKAKFQDQTSMILQRFLYIYTEIQDSFSFAMNRLNSYFSLWSDFDGSVLVWQLIVPGNLTSQNVALQDKNARVLSLVSIYDYFRHGLQTLLDKGQGRQRWYKYILLANRSVNLQSVQMFSLQKMLLSLKTITIPEQLKCHETETFSVESLFQIVTSFSHFSKD